MAGEEEAIGALGLLILIGLASRLFLKKTGLSDLFILMLVGIAAGLFIPAQTIQTLSAFALPFAAITLFMIILGEGLNISIEHAKHLHKALLLGTFSFFFSFLSIFVILNFAIDAELFVLLTVASIFGGIAPELALSVISGLGRGKEAAAIGELEAVFSDALSIMLALVFLSAAISGKEPQFLPFELAFEVLLSVAAGAVFAAFWKAFLFKSEEEHQHLLVIGLAAILYAISGLLGANGVISVFIFAFFLGNLSHPSINEMRRFQFELSFFLRTFFFVYLGMLLFHSPKPFELATIALACSLTLAFFRLVCTRLVLFIAPEAKEERILEFISGRGLTSAVLSVFTHQKFTSHGISSIDLPLFALFVIFFTNAISAFLLFKKRKLKAAG
ncbi:MAG: hypothetical protein QXT25_01305 [Candidatus Anstonellaceae archaeon]